MIKTSQDRFVSELIYWLFYTAKCPTHKNKHEIDTHYERKFSHNIKIKQRMLFVPQNLHEIHIIFMLNLHKKIFACGVECFDIFSWKNYYLHSISRICKSNIDLIRKMLASNSHQIFYIWKWHKKFRMEFVCIKLKYFYLVLLF